MTSGVRFRAYPTAALQSTLRLWIGHQRFIYNCKVRELRYFRTFARHSLALTGQQPLPDQAYSQFRGPDTAWLKDVPSQLLRNGAYRFATGCARMLKGLSGAPTIRKKHGRQSVLLTSELFRFVAHPNPNPAKADEPHWHLELGTESQPIGRLHFKAHRSFELPKMLCISVEPDGRWFVSFSYDAPALAEDGEDPVILRSPKELAYEYSLRADLKQITVGIDRGVALPLAVSNGKEFRVDEVNARRIAKKEARAQRYQRRLARQVKGSKQRERTKRCIARLKGYGRQVREDFAHKTSHALVTSDACVFVFEDLKLKNMTAAPAPRRDEQGRYARNGAVAKAGLNRALLANALGQVKQFTTYKAAQRNKLVIAVPPAYSSQECAECGHVAAENRVSQAEFRCVKCDHTDHADHNAARVIQQRGVTRLKEGTVVFRKKKTARVRGQKQTVGSVRSEPGEYDRPTPGESMSDATCRSAAGGATLAEPGNRHLNADRR